MAFCGLVNSKNNLELDNTEADFFSFYQSSGNPVFDHQLRMECNNLRCCFGVRCAVKLNGVRNSYATPLVLPGLDPYSDGLVTLGLPVLGHHLMNYDPTAGTIPFILAHEFGHIFSFKYNLGLAAGESTNKNEELFADFCAGMYLRARGGNWISTKKAFYDIGTECMLN